MSTFLVTIQGAHRQADLELPGDVQINELIPLLRAMCDVPPDQSQDTSPWTFYVPTLKKLLPTDITLGESGVLNGDMLFLQAQSSFNAHKNAGDETLIRSKTSLAEPKTELIGVTWEKEWQF